MIKWKNGKPVQAVMSHNFEGLTLTLNKFNKNNNELEFIDKTKVGRYYTFDDYVEFIVPEDVEKGKTLRDMMIIKEEDYFVK